MNGFWLSITTILTALVGVAIVGEIVSQNAQTGTIITDFGNAYSNILKVAVSPVTNNGSLTL